MKNRRAFFSLPLLAKELTEIAARRRTYTTRVVYAVLLYAGFALINRSLFQNMGVQEFRSLGVGRQMFDALMVLQIFGIYLFLPAMAAGQITQEKERDSLVLLFLTELTPWQMLLQKYAGALIAIFSFLLIGMPLAALCYACGGLSPMTLFTGVYVLFLTSLQVAAFALMCSAFARTTVAAFVATYIGQVVLFFGLGMFGELLNRWLPGNNYPEKMLQVFPAYPRTLLRENALSSYVAMAQLFKRTSSTASLVLLRSLPSLGATALFLLLARFFFVRRAFAPARNRLLALFRRVDAFMQRANRRIGGVTFLRRDRALPGDDPIAWRELTRTALGRPHYLARVLLALEIPTLVLGMCAVLDGPHSDALSSIAAVLGALAVLALSAFSANAFVSERVNQTLEVLLTTPLRAADIVRQKARMLSRFAWVLAVPVGSVFAMSWWIRWDMDWQRWRANDDSAGFTFSARC